MKERMLIAILLVFGSYASAAQQTRAIDPGRLLRDDNQQRAQWADDWLRSDDPRSIAWGAWLARKDQQKALIPLLLEKVDNYQASDQSPSVQRDRHDALLAVLDAVIELNGPVPVEQARKLYPEFAAQAVILLVRSREDSQSALLDILRDTRANWTWLAAGNVLFKKRTPGFAALLLSRFTQHVTVTVFDPGHGGGYGGGGSECGFSLRAPKQGWPPVGLYALTQFPDRIPWITATFLVGGDTPVYYLRAEPGNYDNPSDIPGSCDDGDRDYYRAQYLNHFLEYANPGWTLTPYPHVSIEWKGGDAYRDQLLRAVDEQRARFRSAVALLRESAAPVLTADESAQLEPKIELVIRDERTDRSVPLPAVLANGGTVTVKSVFGRPMY